MKHSYKPLPDYLIIKPSKVHGLGVFTDMNILQEFTFPISHYLIHRSGLGFSEDKTIRTPFGGYINHSDDPNIRLMGIGTKGYMIFNPVAIRNIEEGEELTLNYLHSEICCDDKKDCDRSKIEFV